MKTMAHLNLKVVALGAATFLASSAGSFLLAQNTPVGPWDIVISGRQRGLMQLTFASDFSVTGSEILTVKPDSPPGNDEEDARTPAGTGRGYDTGSSTGTKVFGGATLDGTWTYDVKGRVIGVLNEIGESGTNGISFTATVRPGVRLNMVGYRSGKKITYRGVPLAALTDVSGDYYSQGIRAGKQFNELFTLTPGPDPNSYDLVGVGPNFSLAGTVLVSAQKQMAIYSVTSETTNGLVRAVVGGFNITKGSGNVTGVSQDPAGSGQPVNVRASVVKQ